jgi:signal-transduction protein with cAMP-binding, CBS, and nucleotidyltransferase domain
MTKVDYARVGDAMSATIRTIDAMASIKDAIKTMRDERVSSLVVKRRDDADEYGMIAVADIARDVIATNRSIERVSVYEVMTKPVLSLPAEMQVKYAVRLLVRYNLTRALVIDHERHPVGIVTLRDLVLRAELA